MIFASAGSQLPFPRLMRVVDQWAARNPETRVIAQVGLDEHDYPNCDVYHSISPESYSATVLQAKVIVSHAGMGTVLTALQHGTPAIIVPRRSDLREARSDHQNATAKWLRKAAHVAVADDAEVLIRMLDGWESIASGAKISPHATPELILAVQEFIMNS